jgi:acyl dehydratase
MAPTSADPARKAELMPLDRSAIGRELPGRSLLVTRTRLRDFAEATGQTDPVYTDVEAARRAGHRDLPVPPTFLFGIDLAGPHSFGYLDELGVDVRTLLHGEQRFTYRAVAHAGDELTATGRISDIYQKKGGLLEFVVKDTVVADQHGAVVAELRSVMIVRNGPVAEESE